jgi:hypothetical protein
VQLREKSASESPISCRSGSNNAKMDPANMTPEEIDEATYLAVSQVIQPTSLSPSDFLAITITLLVLVVCTVALRLWANHAHSGRIFVDDYMCFVSITCLTWNIAIFYILISALNRDARDVTVDWFTPYAAVGIFAGNMALYTAKLPLLFFYIRTFAVVKWLRYTSWALVVVGGLGFLGTATYASVECSPQIHGDEFPPVAFFTCILGITNACIARASISLTMDVILFFLPMPVIKGLNLPTRRKAGLALVFTAGSLAIVASGVGLYYQEEQQRGGSSDNFANALVLT